LQVTESWQEVLRMLVVDCNDDDVDSVLLAIATPSGAEEKSMTALPRLVLAARCLTDEPNVSNSLAVQVLQGFCDEGARRGVSRHGGPVQIATTEIAASPWAATQEWCLGRTYLTCGETHRMGVSNFLVWTRRYGDLEDTDAMANRLLARLQSPEPEHRVIAALQIMKQSFTNLASIAKLTKAIPVLQELLRREPAEASAAAWAMVQLCGGWLAQHEHPTVQSRILSVEQLQFIHATLVSVPPTEYFLRHCLINILGNGEHEPATGLLITELETTTERSARGAAAALGRIGTDAAITALIEALRTSKDRTLDRVIDALRKRRDSRAVEPLTALYHAQLAAAAADESPVSEAGKLRGTIVGALLGIGDPRSVNLFYTALEDQSPQASLAGAAGLRRYGIPIGLEKLLSYLESDDRQRRLLAVEFLATDDDPIDRVLLSENLNGSRPFVDPREGIDAGRIGYAARTLYLTFPDVHERYLKLAKTYGLTVIADLRSPTLN
jgi:HEAT repeat protein